MNEAIGQGRIPRELPFVRREALAAVTPEYADKDAALQAIAAGCASTTGRTRRRRVGRRARRRRHAGSVGAKRVSGDEGDMGHVSEPPRPHRDARLFPLPRRQAQDQGRARHQAGLRDVPQRAGSNLSEGVYAPTMDDCRCRVISRRRARRRVGDGRPRPQRRAAGLAPRTCRAPSHRGARRRPRSSPRHRLRACSLPPDQHRRPAPPTSATTPASTCHEAQKKGYADTMHGRTGPSAVAGREAGLRDLSRARVRSTSTIRDDARLDPRVRARSRRARATPPA